MSPQIVRRCLLAAALVVATWNLAGRRAEPPADPAAMPRSVLVPVESGAAAYAGGGVNR
ncbi:MAG: hypothetical protein JNK76_17860 [Planctomycetales bacterium]|nr:hypothetical protein [Planctomycetales bacterium]